MGDINLSSDDKAPKKKFLGVRYEASISMGTLLVLVGFALQALYISVGIEHRLTSNEKDIAYATKTMDGWHQDAMAARTVVANDIGGLRQSVSQLNERVDIMATSRK